ncbi:hypothetical protein [Paraburkholderia sp.]|uniref:hypothetical protein n=1 Tax=Paraburkholderia sp. TaxID=1926495 RepID=UPI0039E5C57D
MFYSAIIAGMRREKNVRRPRAGPSVRRIPIPGKIAYEAYAPLADAILAGSRPQKNPRQFFSGNFYFCLNMEDIFSSLLGKFNCAIYPKLDLTRFY